MASNAEISSVKVDSMAEVKSSSNEAISHTENEIDFECGSGFPTNAIKIKKQTLTFEFALT